MLSHLMHIIIVLLRRCPHLRLLKMKWLALAVAVAVLESAGAVSVGTRASDFGA